MRRISFSRPKEKVRGAERRLKAIEAWAAAFEGQFPSEWATERYVEFKLPAVDRLVNPPTAKVEHQVRAMRALIQACRHLNAAKLKEHADKPMDLIFTWPELWDSRITIFFDKSYHDTFYCQDGEWQKRIPLEKGPSELPIPIPDDFAHKAIKFMNRDFDGEETTPWYTEEWHVLSPKIS